MLTPKRKSQKNHEVTSDEYRFFKGSIGKLLWVSIQTRPDISFDVCQLSNHLSDPNVQDLITINKIISRLQNESEIMLTFRAIDLQTVKLHVYADSAYGNLPRHGSQCGYVIFLTDEHEKIFNPIVWKSVKIERVCQSALAAEGLGMVKAIDHAIFVEQTLMKMMQIERKIPINCFTDSKSLYDVLLKTKDPEEKKLVCILAPIRDSIARGEIEVFRIGTKEMPADILTKRGVNSKCLRFHLEN